MVSISKPGSIGVNASKLIFPAVKTMARELVDRESKAAAEEAGVLRVNLGPFSEVLALLSTVFFAFVLSIEFRRLA